MRERDEEGEEEFLTRTGEEPFLRGFGAGKGEEGEIEAIGCYERIGNENLSEREKDRQKDRDRQIGWQRTHNDFHRSNQNK